MKSMLELAKTICEYLEAESHGVYEIDLFASFRDKPDEAVFVIPRGPQKGVFEQPNGLPLDGRANLQIIVRGKTGIATEAKAKAVHDELHLANQLVNPFYIYTSRAIQAPAKMEKDDKARVRFSFNVQLHLRKVN